MSVLTCSFLSFTKQASTKWKHRPFSLHSQHFKKHIKVGKEGSEGKILAYPRVRNSLDFQNPCKSHEGVRATHNPNTQEMKTQRIPRTIQILASANKWGDHQSIHMVETKGILVTQEPLKRTGHSSIVTHWKCTHPQVFQVLLLFSACIQYIHKYILYMYCTHYI